MATRVYIAAEQPGAPVGNRSTAHERIRLWLILALYVAIVVFAAAHHEMWRDEARALSMARDATLGDLFRELKYEGHPALWFLLLRAGWLVTGSVLVLPGLSLLVAISTVYLILRLAPFSWPQKLLVVLGVFPLFEYSVVARNYGLGAFFIIVLAILYPTRLERPLRWGLLIALLANTSAHAAVIAAALLASTAWDMLVALRRRTMAASRRFFWRICAGGVIGIAGLVAARATVSTNRLPGEAAPMPGAATMAHQVALSALNPGLYLEPLAPFPVADLGDSHRRFHRSVAEAAVIDIVLAGMVIGLWGEWSLLLLVITAVLGSTAFFRAVYGAQVRHLGLLWFTLLLVYWEVVRRRQLPGTLGGRPRRWWALTVPLTAVMLLQAVEGIRRVAQDVTGTWSSGKAVAALLRQPEYRTAIVTATNDYWLEPLAYYSPNRLYFHNQRRFETHVDLTRPFFGNHGIAWLLTSAATLDSMTHSPVLLLVSDRDLAQSSSIDSLMVRQQTLEVAALNHAIGDESYHVLRWRTPPDSTVRAPY